MSRGLKWCSPPGETWVTHSFWLSVWLLILSAISSKVQEDVWEWIIDFHLPSDWSRSAAYFQVTLFIFTAINTNINLIHLWVSTFHGICKTTSPFLIAISRWRATAASSITPKCRVVTSSKKRFIEGQHSLQKILNVVSVMGLRT